MIGNMISPFEGVYKPPSPDDYFDPVTHVATEENFIKFLQAGIYTEDVIGYKVQLSNSVGYNNGLWIIADVNHDSENTGQTNCYDLISVDCVGQNVTMENYYWTTNYRILNYLNGNFYNGFSGIKSHIINIKYKSEGSWYDDSKIIIPSIIEIGGWKNGSMNIEGIPYPIFPDHDNSSSAFRCKHASNTSSDLVAWWTRSIYLGDSDYYWISNSTGYATQQYRWTSAYYPALFRVQ